MEQKCTGKVIMLGLNLMFGLFGYKTRGSCVSNKTAEIKGSFNIFSVRKITYELMKWWFIVSVGCVVSGSDTSCNSVFD